MKLNSLKTLVLVGALLLTPAAFAADGQLAAVHANSNGLSFDALVNHGGSTLVVSGPDGYNFRQTFAAGVDAQFSIFDQQGGLLADGTYTYELRFSPRLDAATRAAMVTARAKGEALNIQAMEPVYGSFTIRDGAVVGNSDAEGGALTSTSAAASSGELTNQVGLDQVFADDVIVQESLCVGVDCVNGENFGFDTIRLKENNLRIKFEDTSTGTFPSTDWQLTANDSNNGGANRFSIDDITAGRTPFTIGNAAPSNSLVVEASTGDIGVGTGSPALELHIVDGDSPAIRLEQDASSGFAAQSWDIAGNETNFFVRDVTNGSKLPFKIFPNAPNNSLTIEGSTGDIGMGTTSPSEALHIFDSSTSALARVLVENTSTTTNNSNVMMQMKNNGSIQMNFTDTQTGSDEIWQINASASFLRIRKAGNATGNEFELDSSGNLTLTGSITTAAGNTCASGCDLVFSPDYALPTIEEHAAEMFENSHLPAVGPTEENGPFNISLKVGGMLNELEKAHIYIAQLNQRLAQRDEEMKTLQATVEELKKLLK